jgi:hypothetical protein
MKRSGSPLYNVSPAYSPPWDGVYSQQSPVYAPPTEDDSVYRATWDASLKRYVYTPKPYQGSVRFGKLPSLTTELWGNILSIIGDRRYVSSIIDELFGRKVAHGVIFVTHWSTLEDIIGEYPEC